MRVFRLFLKIPAFFLMVITGLFRWIGTFVIIMSNWIFYVAASILFIIGALCFAFQQATAQQVLPLLIVGFILYILPHIGIWFANMLGGMNIWLRQFVRS